MRVADSPRDVDAAAGAGANCNACSSGTELKFERCGMMWSGWLGGAARWGTAVPLAASACGRVVGFAGAASGIRCTTGEAVADGLAGSLSPKKASGLRLTVGLLTGLASGLGGSLVTAVAAGGAVGARDTKSTICGCVASGWRWLVAGEVAVATAVGAAFFGSGAGGMGSPSSSHRSDGSGPMSVGTIFGWVGCSAIGRDGETAVSASKFAVGLLGGGAGFGRGGCVGRSLCRCTVSDCWLGWGGGVAAMFSAAGCGRCVGLSLCCCGIGGC